MGGDHGVKQETTKTTPPRPILAVCLNPALDMTYSVARLLHGNSHRVGHPLVRAGGKGVNVARVLQQLDQPVRLLGFAGGPDGKSCTQDLKAGGLPSRLVPIAESTRRTVAVVDAADATVFNETGPTISASEWAAFMEAFRHEAAASRWIVLSGSVPPGVPPIAYQQLISAAHTVGARCIIDTEGIPLRKSLAANPDLAKPNVHEAAALFGRPLRGIPEIRQAAVELRQLGAKTVAISAGSTGTVLVSEDGAWHAKPQRRYQGNPTGAGDALTASIASGLNRDLDWPTLLREATATATAAVVAKTAGEIDEATRHKAMADIVIEEI
ncbi:hypothetical protein AL755_03740 (plasmid) [Arthrobacter sp. ERGS1:01]|uniref:1-phosphofructokinase family hexose kinase n=1 Tax=Arthrobacter sp. ERGS1:01 TaxID=1704044 RepID=UPI0006B51AB7|nr:1-phosphofructokinase family hexose kinase [Arthrobacter sp. ERGS1:01]ALE04805.1 hypothetical protein AL755_03740 [Arthrobacter sp. ERGS1:01]